MYSNALVRFGFFAILVITATAWKQAWRRWTLEKAAPRA
jgi:hypothetical protein